MRYLSIIALTWTCLLCGILSAHAQQPGSAAYNSVYLPAHGVGDTVRGRGPERWGGVAVGDHGLLGWTLQAGDEQQAAEQAIQVCVENGGVDCQILGTFSNSCMVIASDIAVANVARGDKVFTTLVHGGEGMRSLRKRALSECSGQCSVVQEGCALPGR